MSAPVLVLTDIYGAWPDASEIAETGCLLVRPDQHVAWRGNAQPDDALALIDLVRGIFRR